jgi:hypothetical protein
MKNETKIKIKTAATLNHTTPQKKGHRQSTHCLHSSLLTTGIDNLDDGVVIQ